MSAKKAPELLPQNNQLQVQQVQLSDDAELITSATVAFMVNGQQRYAKTELKEVRLDGEDFDDFSFRCVDLVKTHILRVVEEISATDINQARSHR